MIASSSQRRDSSPIEHLHQCSVCGTALKIMDEVQEFISSKAIGRLICDPGKMISFQGPWKESNKYNQVIF
jgi:hypothetical protein